MSVTVAKNAGFCFGVSRAVETVEREVKAGKKVSKEPLCCQASMAPTSKPLHTTGGRGESHLRRHLAVHRAASSVAREPTTMSSGP